MIHPLHAFPHLKSTRVLQTKTTAREKPLLSKSPSCSTLCCPAGPVVCCACRRGSALAFAAASDGGQPRICAGCSACGPASIAPSGPIGLVDSFLTWSSLPAGSLAQPRPGKSAAESVGHETDSRQLTIAWGGLKQRPPARGQLRTAAMHVANTNGAWGGGGAVKPAGGASERG